MSNTFNNLKFKCLCYSLVMLITYHFITKGYYLFNNKYETYMKTNLFLHDVLENNMELIINAPVKNNMSESFPFLNKFTYELIKSRSELIQEYRNSSITPWKLSSQKYLWERPNKKINGKNVNYWTSVTSLHTIKTVSLNCTMDHLESRKNSILYCGMKDVNVYYHPVVEDGVCLLKNDSPNCEKHKESLHPLYKSADVKSIIEHSNLHTPTFFVHLIPHGIIDQDGNVHTKDIEILAKQCSAGWRARLISNTQIHHSEVFVISQFWGDGFFHFSVEDFPRLIASLDFLKLYPHIKIHIQAGIGMVQNLFEVIGLDLNRLIHGQVSADIVYMPQGSACGKFHQPSGQMVSSYIHQYIRNNILNNLPDNNSQLRNIILVKRHSKRWLAPSYHQAIADHLQKTASAYGLQLKIFDDNQLPSKDELFSMFYNAVLVVGPHGAGLSNVMIARPGTYVIEIFCLYNSCYQDLAVSLGMNYYGLAATNRKCDKMTIHLENLYKKSDEFVKKYVSDNKI